MFIFSLSQTKSEVFFVAEHLSRSRIRLKDKLIFPLLCLPCDETLETTCSNQLKLFMFACVLLGYVTWKSLGQVLLSGGTTYKHFYLQSFLYRLSSLCSHFRFPLHLSFVSQKCSSWISIYLLLFTYCHAYTISNIFCSLICLFTRPKRNIRLEEPYHVAAD